MKFAANLLIALIVMIAWAVPLEFGLRWWFAHKGNPVDQVMPLLRPDAALLWRQRADADLTLWKLPVRTNEFGFREGKWDFAGLPGVLVLGPSSAFGWGVEEKDTYARQWERREGEAGHPLRVLNASQIGFSSAQGLRLAEQPEIASLKPMAVLIAYGVNDLDRFRFFGANGPADEKIFAAGMESPPAAFYRSMLLYGLLRSAGIIRSRLDCRVLGHPEPRVNEADFLENFQRLGTWAKERGALPVFLTTPFLRRASLEAQAAASARIELLYSAAADAATRGDCAAARRDFTAARELESASIEGRVTKRNQALLAWAKRSGKKTVDVDALLDSAADFVDPVHPSPQGHAKIAAALSALRIAKPRTGK